jgi:hypothetical protein
MRAVLLLLLLLPPSERAKQRCFILIEIHKEQHPLRCVCAVRLLVGANV